MPETPSLTAPANILQIVLAIALALTLAIVIALAVASMLRRAFIALDSERVGPALARSTVRLVRLVTFVVFFVIFAFPALDLAGVALPVGLHSTELGRWLTETGVRIAMLVLGAVAVVRVLGALIARAELDLSTGTGIDALERRKRAQTVAGLVRRSLAILIWTTVLLMVLRELDVDITPVLTGAGILGLAVGFGAQTLVRDVISGFFLIIEDQVRVGDVASVNGTGGFVEQINLRTIVLRDLEGTVHVFPNGAITTLSNMTKDFSYFVLDLIVPFEEDTDRVIELVETTAAALRADPRFGVNILDALEVLGVDGFGRADVTVKVRIKTAPIKQWEVGRELRRRLRQAFVANGIRLSAQRVSVVADPSTRPAPEAGA